MAGWSLLNDSDAFKRAGVPILRLRNGQYRIKTTLAFASGYVRHRLQVAALGNIRFDGSFHVGHAF
jgi:hypothetical protein